MRIPNLLTLALAGLSLQSPLAAQDAADSTATELSPEQMEALLASMTDSLEASYTYQNGAIPIADGVATLTIPEGFKFLDGEQSRQVIVDVWGNPPDVAADVLGMILPTDAGVLDNTFTFVVEYDPMGYVSDADATDIDYAEMMEGMKADDAEDNRQRREAGYEGLELVGWAAPPFYDAERKVLHWAKELRADEAEENSLNYNVRVLGRKGVLIMNAVGSMSELSAVQAAIPNVLAMASFNPGHTYAEFDSKVDDVAAWTVGGLVAGKVLAKTGFLALILKNIKLIVIALGAAGVGLWKYFGRRKDTPPGEPQA
jgi:uncharacterized membrane-anchored protein